MLLLSLAVHNCYFFLLLITCLTEIIAAARGWLTLWFVFQNIRQCLISVPSWVTTSSTTRFSPWWVILDSQHTAYIQLYTVHWEKHLIILNSSGVRWLLWICRFSGSDVSMNFSPLFPVTPLVKLQSLSFLPPKQRCIFIWMNIYDMNFYCQCRCPIFAIIIIKI